MIIKMKTNFILAVLNALLRGKVVPGAPEGWATGKVGPIKIAFDYDYRHPPALPYEVRLGLGQLHVWIWRGHAMVVQSDDPLVDPL